MTALVVAGLVTGSIYAISALGLVLTYVSSKVFNFAHGMIGLFVAWCFYQFDTVWEWSVLPSALVALGVVAPLLGLALWAVLFRRLARTAALVRLAATIGLSVVLPPVVILVFGTEVVFRPTGLAGSSDRLVDVADVNLNLSQIAVAVVAVVVAVGMALVLRFTTFGLTMRASVDSPTVAELHGTNTDLVAAGAWMIGSTLAGLAGVLLIPFLGLDTPDFMLAFIAASAAAVIGRMRSMPVTFVGALVLGVVQETSTLWLPQGPAFVGLRTAIPFLLMMVALILQNMWRPESRAPDAPALDPTPAPAGGHRRLVLPAAAVLFLATPLWLDGFWLGLVGLGVTLGVIFLSYTVITGMGAMISLAQVSFAAIGALTAAELATLQGWPVTVAILAGGIVAVPFGLLIALPAMRWAGLYLALGTLAFAFLVDNLIFKIERYDDFGQGIVLDRPAIGSFAFDDDTPFFYLSVAVFAVIAWFVVRLRDSTTGMLFGAIRGSERATMSIGFSVLRAKLTLFAISSFVAGLGGGLYASYLGRAAPQQFAATVGLVWLAVIVTVGVRSILAALIAGVSFVVLPQLFSFNLSEEWQHVPAILFGLGAIGLATEPRGALVQVATAVGRLRARLAHSVTRSNPPPAPDDGDELVGAVPARRTP